MGTFATNLPPTLQLLDQPEWSDLDMFSLYPLSSSPSWVSDSQPADSAQETPNLPCERHSNHSDGLVPLPNVPEYGRQDRPVREIDEQFSSDSSQLLALFSRTEPPCLPTYSKGMAEPAFEHVLTNSGAIIDDQLDFPSPSSPILSDLPETNVSRDSFPPRSVQVMRSSLTNNPFPPHTVVEQKTAPNSFYQPQLLNISTAPASNNTSSIGDCSSNESSLSLKFLQPCELGKKDTVAQTVRTTKCALTGRVRKQTRRYSAPKSSRYCHLCARHQRCVEMIPCGNLELGLCQKSVCKKCIDVYKLEVEGPSWACPHCQNKCPQRAKCYAYDRQTARRREKTLRAKLSTFSLHARCAGSSSRQ